jgi:hypothetical protein
MLLVKQELIGIEEKHDELDAQGAAMAHAVSSEASGSGVAAAAGESADDYTPESRAAIDEAMAADQPSLPAKPAKGISGYMGSSDERYLG